MRIVYGLSDSLYWFPSANLDGTRRNRWHDWCYYKCQGVMKTKTGFIQLLSAMFGLSVGVGVMTATVLLGVAALLQ